MADLKNLETKKLKQAFFKWNTWKPLGIVQNIEQ